MSTICQAQTFDWLESVIHVAFVGKPGIGSSPSLDFVVLPYRKLRQALPGPVSHYNIMYEIICNRRRHM